MRNGVRKILGLLIGMLAAPALHAEPGFPTEPFPSKPITLIVAYGPGGQTDVTARALAPFIEKHLGNGAHVVTVNKPGSGGEIGFAAIADAKPDGHTIGFINTPSILTIPIERRARYLTERLTPLVNIIDDPGVLVVRQDSPIRTLGDLVALARKNPRTIRIASTGLGSDDHLAILALQRLAQVEFVHVPYTTSIENYRAMLNGATMVSATNIGEAMRGIQTDPVRVLGVMAETRSPLAPNLPTFKEQGYAMVMGSMRGLAAPQGLPSDVRARLVEAITKAVEDPEFREIAARTFQPLRVLDPMAFTGELAEIEDFYRRLWRETPWIGQ